MNWYSLFFIGQAWAAAGGDGHAPSMTTLLYPTINFLIFAFLIYRFALPSVRRILLSRRDQIRDEVGSADQSIEKAKATLQEYRDRLAAADNEVQALIETLRAEGEREKAKIIRDAEELGAKVKADAEFISQQETKVARQQVRDEIARVAHQSAEAIIQSHLRPVDQERFVEQFLQGIEGTR